MFSQPEVSIKSSEVDPTFLSYSTLPLSRSLIIVYCTHPKGIPVGLCFSLAPL